MKLKQQTIPYGCQWLDDSDIESVVEVLRSDRITQGPKVEEFESKFASHVGAKHAVAVSSGTAGLHLSAIAMGIKSGDEVITSPITLLATANAVIYAGAKPVFSDIDSDTFCLDPSEVEKRITQRTKAVFAVHFAGHPANLEKLSEICKKHNLLLLEDACHALGAQFKQGRIGNTAFSDAAVFSFHPVKHITTGEGGMITTNNSEIYQKLIHLRSHGVTWDRNKFKNDYEGPWQYEMQELGFNYRVTDFQAALGLSQLNKIDVFVSKRREIAKLYRNAFKNLDAFILPIEEEDCIHAYHLYPVCLKLDKLAWSRREVFEALRNAGVGVQVHYIPIPRQPYYQNLGYRYQDYPKAELFYQSEISLPIFPKMTKEQTEYVIQTVTNVINEAQR